MVQLRPIHPMDGNKAQLFRNLLSDKTLRNRFLGYVPKITEELIKDLTHINYEEEMAIIAEIDEGGMSVPIAIARLAKDKSKGTVEFGIIIADNWQGIGLGQLLTRNMINIAIELGFDTIIAYLYANNIRMEEILRAEGFLIHNEDYNVNKAILKLGDRHITNPKIEESLGLEMV